MPPRLVATAVLSLLLSPCLAQAQSAPRPEASAPAPAPTLLLTGGYVAFADDGTIDHTAGGVGLEWRVRSHLAVATEIAYMVGPGSDRDLLMSAALRVSMLRWHKPVVPYGAIAAGPLLHRERVFGRDVSDIGLLLQVGGGVRIAAGRRVFIAPEVACGGPPYVRATLTVGITLR